MFYLFFTKFNGCLLGRLFFCLFSVRIGQKMLLATRHDILIYYKGGKTPNEDTRRAVPHVVEKIFGDLDQDALTQARAVS